MSETKTAESKRKEKLQSWLWCFPCVTAPKKLDDELTCTIPPDECCFAVPCDWVECGDADPRCACMRTVARLLLFVLQFFASWIVIPPLFLVAGVVRAALVAFWMAWDGVVDAWSSPRIGWALRLFATSYWALILIPLAIVANTMFGIVSGLLVAIVWPWTISWYARDASLFKCAALGQLLVLFASARTGPRPKETLPLHSRLAKLSNQDAMLNAPNGSLVLYVAIALVGAVLQTPIVALVLLIRLVAYMWALVMVLCCCRGRLPAAGESKHDCVVASDEDPICIWCWIPLCCPLTYAWFGIVGPALEMPIRAVVAGCSAYEPEWNRWGGLRACVDYVGKTLCRQDKRLFSPIMSGGDGCGTLGVPMAVDRRFVPAPLCESNGDASNVV